MSRPLPPMGDAMSPPGLAFLHPAPRRPRPRLRPFFLPWQGCPGRCVYCDQPAQTGDRSFAPEEELHRLRDMLEASRIRGDAPFELGFFGGTFFMLPSARRLGLLRIAADYKRLGLVTRLRCSTRPDSVTAASLSESRSQGLDLVELGVQTFDDATLAASGRGYSGAQAEDACRMVQAAGLSLGVQLLPGLPGSPGTSGAGTLERRRDASPRKIAYVHDTIRTASLKPEVARVYPCLVIKGTPLADLWRAGRYRPWTLARAVEELARSLPVFWRAGVSVIRMGLAPEPTLLPSILAGPWADDLGFRARSLALSLHVRTYLAMLGRTPRRIMVPRRHVSEFLGHKRARLPRWERLGLPRERIVVWEREWFWVE